MFTALGRFFSWVSLKFYASRMSIQYDSALNDLKRRRSLVKKAIANNFESVFDLTSLVDKANLRLASSHKIASGAADFYLDDPDDPYAPRHRKEGEEALTKVNQLTQKVAEWDSMRRAHHTTLLELQRIDIQLEEDLDFLRAEKPRALASLKASHYETSIHKAMAQTGELDAHADEQMAVLNKYRNQQKAWVSTREFLRRDPRDVYRRRSEGESVRSASDEFEDKLRQRQAGRQTVDLVVVNKE